MIRPLAYRLTIHPALDELSKLYIKEANIYRLRSEETYRNKQVTNEQSRE